MMILFSRCVCN